MYRGEHRTPNRKRPFAVAGAATALAAGMLAAPAQASDGDPHVIVKGGAGCKQLLYKASYVQFFLDNGEFAQSAFTNGSYRVEFFNIPGSTVTNSGSFNGVTGYAAVYCTSIVNPSSTYYWIAPLKVQRPRVGIIQSTNLGGG